MNPAVTVKENYEFRRIYRKGRSAVSPCLVVYCQKNRRGQSRLGVTVSTKLGHAVVRNRVRRRLREIYRLNREKMPAGYDIIIVARVLKRLMDIIVSAIGLVIASPIMLVTALAIKLEDHGPVFYRQKRATYAGRIFEVYKFRSMRVEDGSIHRSVTKDDDRITHVGHIIRKFRIDELPQLINVLKSDMSIVGPRPEMIENVDKYTQELPEFTYRLRAKAGLTGLAQIYGRYNTSPKDKLIMDLTYIQEYSLWLDVKLILRTVLVLLTPDDSTEAFEQTEEEKP